MRGKAMLSSGLAALLTILWTGLSPGQSGSPSDWTAATLEALAPASVDAGRWRRLVGQLKAGGLSMESAQECLAPVQEAVRQGLPIDPVLTRVEEGAAKSVEGKALQEAGRQRLVNLQSAAVVLRQAGYVSGNALHDQLMKSVTLALESGLSANTLQGVLSRAKGKQSERMRSIVEAGETMCLSGMDETTVGQMMADFTERNMRRTEVMRASRFAVQQHRAHMEGARIRQQLWDGTGMGGRWGRGANMPGAFGSKSDAGGPADRGSGPMGSGAQSGQGGPSTSPGNAPPNAEGNGHGGGGNRGSGGSGSHEGNAPTDIGPRGSTQNQGR